MTAGPVRSGAYGPVRRKEDARFIRGQGTFVDDIQLPGMLHGAILRSPLAHARIVSVDTAAAQAHPKVEAVITGETLAGRALAWMPTLSQDVQAVLATDKVRFQGQEVAFVVAQDRYAARDALELINVEYEPLPVVIDAQRALDPGAPVIRDDRDGQADNHIFDWEAGDQAATDAVFAAADVVVAQDMLYPRSHPAPLETCGAVADFNQVTGQLTVWSTTQAPHAHRTLYALVAGIPEHKIRIISPDIGGGFGNKVPVYPGYICAVVGSMVTGRPVKWVEDRSENLMSTSFARDYHMHGEIAATREGRILGIRAKVLADHGAFNGAAQPTKFPAGFFHIFTGSYDLRAAHCEVTGVYTNKAPGGVAYSCSFRITEAVYLIERLVDVLAAELGLDAGRSSGCRTCCGPSSSPTPARPAGSTTQATTRGRCSWPWTSPDTTSCAASRRRSGPAASTWASGSASSPRGSARDRGRRWTSWAWAWRTAPTCAFTRPGKAVLAISVQTQGQGHETTFAQIVAQELGLSPDDVEVVHGDTDRTPFGLGTYGSRSTPVSGAAAAVVARKVRERARIVAAAMLEVSPDDLEWATGKWQVRGDPEQARNLAEIAMAAHSALELPDGIEGHLDAETVYNPPNLTYPFGAYICVTDVDPGTGQVSLRRFIAVDDCGVQINPMIVEGQVHGGLADGLGMAMMQVIAFDADGNCLGGSFMDYLLPTSVECPSWELGETVTPSPHHPIGAKGIGESATVGSPPAVVNSVLDALRPFGVRHADMPLTPANVWSAIQGHPLRTDLAIT